MGPGLSHWFCGMGSRSVLTLRTRIHDYLLGGCQIVKPDSKRQNPSLPRSLELPVTISIQVPETPGMINSAVMVLNYFPMTQCFVPSSPKMLCIFKTSSHRLSPPTHFFFASPSRCPWGDVILWSLLVETILCLVALSRLSGKLLKGCHASPRSPSPLDLIIMGGHFFLLPSRI